MYPTLTRDQVRRVDELAVSKYHIPSLILMENAGKNAATIIDRQYGPHGSASIVCGPGNNGGDGFVIARHLHNAGWQVRVHLAGGEDRLSADARTNLHIARAMSIHFVGKADPTEADVVVDALLGTGFSGTLRPDAADLIEQINASKKRAVVGVDVPSGLDCDTGLPCPNAVRADLTITFVAAKPGLLQPAAALWVGELEVADIGAPGEVIQEVLRTWK